MARLQDFQTVTPTASDKILIVQSQGQGLALHSIKLDSTNPTGTGSLSLNRSGSIGSYSVAVGQNCTASGNYSHAEGSTTSATNQTAHSEGSGTTASGLASHAEGEATTASGRDAHSEGRNSIASGIESHAEGNGTEASGVRSHTEGRATIANHRSQHVFGEFNVADTSTAESDARGNYVEIVGNGASTSARSNARTLDWSGNEVLAGDLTINGNVSLSTSMTRRTSKTSTSTAVSKKITIPSDCASGLLIVGSNSAGSFGIIAEISGTYYLYMLQNNNSVSISGNEITIGTNYTHIKILY